MITLDEATHIYTTSEGEPYISVSQILKNFQEPFDPDGHIARAVAKKRGVHSSVIKDEWKATADKANSHGTNIHSTLQNYIETGKEPEINTIESEYVKSFKTIEFKGKVSCEVLLYNDKYKIAGTTDLKEKYKKRYNLWDYKTNKEITFFSKYDKTFLPPLNHLEDCKFNYYALQLSFYAWLCEQNNETIGRLGILWFDPEKVLHIFNVPYMRYEIEAIINSKNFSNYYEEWKLEIKQKLNKNK